LDVDDLGLLAFRKVALGVHDDAATYGAVGAGVAGFGSAGKLERTNCCRIGRFDSTESERSDCRASKSRACASHELASREFNVQAFLLSLLPPTGDNSVRADHAIDRSYGSSDVFD